MKRRTQYTKMPSMRDWLCLATVVGRDEDHALCSIRLCAARATGISLTDSLVVQARYLINRYSCLLLAEAFFRTSSALDFQRSYMRLVAATSAKPEIESVSH